MSHMPDFCPNNSIPPIFYGNNHSDCNLAIMVARNCLKFPLNQFLRQFEATIMEFSEKLKFLFLVNLHHFIEHYEARKNEEPI